MATLPRSSSIDYMLRQQEEEWERQRREQARMEEEQRQRDAEHLEAAKAAEAAALESAEESRKQSQAAAESAAAASQEAAAEAHESAVSEDEEKPEAEEEKPVVENGKIQIGPTNRPFTEEQSFLLHQRKAVNETKTRTEKVGELENLPEHLEPHREMLEKMNKKGELIPSALNDWGANRISIDFGSIKDNNQAAYFMTTLDTDSDKHRYLKEYANRTNQSYYTLLNQFEAKLGNRLFETPQSSAAKIKAYNQGLANQNLMDVDGNVLDLNTATQPQIEQAIRMIPDQQAHKDAVAYYKKLAEVRGWSIDADSLDFLDSADLTQKDYNSAVSEYNELFTIGYTPENEAAYLEELAYIQSQGYIPRVQKQMEAALKKSYEARTKMVAPALEEIQAAVQQEAADDPQKANLSFWESVAAWDEKMQGSLVEFWSGVNALFMGKGEAEEQKPDPLLTEDAETDETPVQSGSSSSIASGGTVTVGGMDLPISQPIASTGGMPPASELFENVDVDAISSPTMRALVEEQQGKTAEAQETVEHPRYTRDIAYDPNMTDEQALSYYLGGGTLDARNEEQIKWFTEDPAARGVMVGLNPKDVRWNTGNARYDTTQYWQYGSKLGAAIGVANSGILTDDMAPSAMLALGRVVKTIRNEVANPANSISIPAGQNMFDYVLGLPEYSGLANTVQSVRDTQKEIARISAENEIEAQKAHQADVQSWTEQVKTGNATPETLGLLAAEYENGEYVNFNDDETYQMFKHQLSERSSYFHDDNGRFWQSDSAAAIEGRNIRTLGGKGASYNEYKWGLKREAMNVLEDYTVAAMSMGMTLEEYLGSAGIESIDQVLDIAYNNMQAVGNAYGKDTEAQQAVQTATVDPESIGMGVAAWTGGRRAVEDRTARLMQASYLILDNANYYQDTVRDLTNSYFAQYGEEAPQMYYSDLMAVIESGQLSQATAQELLSNIQSTPNIFEIGYEIDGGMLESLLRDPAEVVAKDVETLDSVIAKLPARERFTANLVGSAADMLFGMGTAAAIGTVTGSPFVGSAAAWGLPAVDQKYDDLAGTGMTKNTRFYVSMAYGGAMALANKAGTGGAMDIWGDLAKNAQRSAYMSKGMPGLIKASLKLAHTQGIQEGIEEVGEVGIDFAFDAAQDAVIAYDKGENPKLSDMFRMTMNNVYETDVAAIGKEVLSSFGMGYAMGGLFALAGAAKSGYAARKGVKMERKYSSISLARQIVDGEVELTEETLGEVYARVQKDFQTPGFSRWIDSANATAREQNNMVTAAMMGAGSESRKAAVKEANKAADYREKEKAAKSAAEAATSRWVDIRQKVMDGDLSLVPSMTTAQQQMGKAHTALREASIAAEKSETAAMERTREWLAACGTFKSQAMGYFANRAVAQRDALAKQLAEKYEAEEARQEASLQEGKEYAEGYVFSEDEVDETAAEKAEALDAMSDEELDQEIETLNAQIADAETRIADVTSRSEELGLSGETVQELVNQELTPLSSRKDRIIAREKSRFNDLFDRQQQLLEMDNDESADLIQAEYAGVYNRLQGLGVDADALMMQQYGIEPETANAAQEAEQTPAEPNETDKATDSISRKMEATQASLDAINPVRRYFSKTPIYVNESQAADILSEEGLKSISQVNRRYGTKLTTDKSKSAMPLDGYPFEDISAETPGVIDAEAEPVGEMLRILHAGKELTARQRAEKEEARAIREQEAKKKADAKAAAKDARRERVYELTGAGNKPERQARQINQVVADENASVEDIDRTVDRIEGVSMSMVAEEVEKKGEAAPEEDFAAAFKDPAMQKLASDLYRNWGIKLRVADLDAHDEGFYDRASNSIVLNKRLTSGEKQRTVVMHELIHFCEQQPWYKQFKQDILAGAYKDEAEIEENRERLRDMGYGEDELDYELVAHAAKPLFEGDELLIGNLLENGKVSAIRRAYAAISQYLARRKAKKMGMGKQYDALVSARKTLAEGLKKAKTAGGTGIRHSIRSMPDGFEYVEVDTDQHIFEGQPKEKYRIIARDYIRNRYVGNVIGEGDNRAYVSGRTAGEYAYPAKRRMDQVVYESKMKAATELDAMMKTAVLVDHNPPEDRHPEFPNGFDLYEVVFSVDGNVFEGTINVGVDAKGRKTFYDVTKIKSLDPGYWIKQHEGAAAQTSNRDFSNNSIQNDGTVVNDQSIQNGVSHSYADMALSQYGNKTAQEIDWINQSVKEQLEGSTHEVRTDRAAIIETMRRIEEMGGVTEAFDDLMSRPYDRWNAQDHEMAQVLMAKAEYDGDITTEAMLAMIYDKAGSEAGLVLQKRKLLARMNAQNALALAAKLSGNFNMRNGGSTQYAPVGDGRPLQKNGENDPAGQIIDRAKRVNDAILKTRGMDDIVERENRWGIPITNTQQYLIEKYGLKHTDLPGLHYNQATTKQRMLAAILATDTSVVYDADMDGNRNGLLSLIQQLEAMKAGKAVETIADLTYISNQMAEMKAQSNGSEDTYLNTEAAQRALARAYDAINNIVPVTLRQKASALAYMNMLSASTTGVKNVLGNVVMGPMEAASETIAAGIDRVVSRKTGNRTTAVSSRAEVAEGLAEGLSEAAKTIADTCIYQTDNSQSRRYDASGDAPRVFQNRPMESKRRFVDMIMQLGDRPFFRAEYARQMEMIKRLCAEGKMKKKDVTTEADGRQVVSYVEMTEADMHKEAAQRALERVFQEDDAIVNWVNSAPANLRPFLQAVIPFVKTPTNIAKRMLDYSPVGLAKTLLVNGVRAARKDGSFDQRSFVMGVGRGLTGTGMIMAGALLHSIGILQIGEGYGEEDDSALYGAGMANYDPYGKHIVVGDNKMALDWLGAAGIWMTIGAAAAKEWDGENMSLGDKLLTTMYKSGPEILNLLFDNTMLSSASELLGGAEDGEELGENVVKTLGGSMLQQMLSPADIRQFAKFTDEYERDYNHDNPVVEALNKNVIRYWPILRQTLPIKYDMTGEPVRQSSKYGWGREDENAVLNFLNMYMSPSSIQSDKVDAALNEVIDLAYRRGETSCIPKNLITASGKVTIPAAMAKKARMDTESGENKLVLTADETRRFNQMYASLCFNGTEKGVRYEKVGVGSYGSLTGIRDLIDSRSYERMRDEEREEEIKAIMKQAKEMTLAQIVNERGYAR